MAYLTRWIELVYPDNSRAELRGNIFQNIQKLAKAIVSDFLAMSILHPFHIQIFEADDRVFLAKTLANCQW